MGLHSAIKPYIANRAKHALLHDLPQGDSPGAPSLCVIDFMWLLFRFSGATGLDLIHFYLRQLFEVYDAGILRAAILTDDARRVPEQKRAEQLRRRKKRAASCDEDPPSDCLTISDELLPYDFTRALMSNHFRERMMAYLARGVDRMLRSALYDNLAKRLLARRNFPAGTKLVACLILGSDPCQTWTWEDGQGWNSANVPIVQPYHGEADLATIDVIRFFVRLDADRGRRTDGVVVRTIDSDSIPILLLLRSRLSSSIPLYLWLPACGAHASSGRPSTYTDAPGAESSIVSIARSVVSSTGVFVPARTTKKVGARSKLWTYENRTLLRIDSMYDDDDIVRFAVLCVIMGTDFNAKLVPRASANAIHEALSRRNIQFVRKCFHSAERLATVCNTISGSDAVAKVPMKEFVNASWTLRYWSGSMGSSGD